MLKAINRSYNNAPTVVLNSLFVLFWSFYCRIREITCLLSYELSKILYYHIFLLPTEILKNHTRKKKRKKKKPTKLTTKNNKERKIKEQKRERTLNFSSGKEEARNSMQPMRNSIEKQPDKVLNKYNKLHLK